jgi:acyl carrier protein
MDAKVRSAIESLIRSIAEERNIRLPEIRDTTEIVDELGFSSLMIATLIANLEEEFGVDPFMDEGVMITDIRTIKDLCTVYADSLQRTH